VVVRDRVASSSRRRRRRRRHRLLEIWFSFLHPKQKEQKKSRFCVCVPIRFLHPFWCSKRDSFWGDFFFSSLKKNAPIFSIFYPKFYKKKIKKKRRKEKKWTNSFRIFIISAHKSQAHPKTTS